MASLRFLLLSFAGRIGRGRFWLGVLLLFLATAILSALALWLGFGMTESRDGYSVINGIRTDFTGFGAAPSPVVSFLISLLLVGPWLAIAVKRRHDRGSAGYDVMAFTALNLLSQLFALVGIGGGIINALGLVVSIWALVLLVQLGFLAGTRGDNAYGPDPLAR